ncbi:VNG_1110C family protein [Halalkalicoccus subterraneus]|uniref:VNG_1110C family protein n=1 Tax=Halalkalicoccus subterraneus TaxID=2675002 RepID=UPI000EFCC35D|nr:hypothetical protein [Halalkalicoccus subterraneus]
MPDPSRLRDSTQIVLPRAALDGIREEVDSAFTVTIVEESGSVRIIGSPVEIKAVNAYLSRHGLTIQ